MNVTMACALSNKHKLLVTQVTSLFFCIKIVRVHCQKRTNAWRLCTQLVHLCVCV